MKSSRAYSVLNWKAVDQEKRIIEGIASTPTPDRMQDVIELDGMSFSLPMPFLYQHQSRQPIGKVVTAKKTKSGLEIKAQLAGPGVAPFIDEAWNLINAGLVPGLSIGFRSIEEAYNRETGGFHFIKTELYEISAVTIPANAECTIQNVKSADALLLAASGHRQRVVMIDNLPGVSGPAKSGSKDMTIKEQIDQFVNKRAAHDARMTAIMDAAGAEGRTLNETETEEYDGLDTEVKSIDGHLVRLRAREKQLAATATVVTKENTADAEKAAATRGGTVVQVNSVIPKGLGFTRALIALANCKGNRFEAAEMTKQRWPDQAEGIIGIIKAEQLPGTVTGTTWAAPLMQSSARLVGEYIEMLRPASIVGRIPNLRRVPFNVTVPVQSGGGTYGWVGENRPKPVSGLSLTTAVLRLTKIAGIIPYTKEALRLSDPSIELTVRNDMIAGTARFMDAQFVDPAVHDSIGVNPPSITDQIVPTAASGLTATFLRNDLRNIMGKFVTNNENLEAAVFLMSASVALNISSMVNALGQPEFPQMSVTGGTLLGIPVIVSQNVGARIILVNPTEILFAEDPGGASIDMSEEASVVMTTTPESSPAATSLVSFWQNNLIGLRVDLFVTWKRGLTSAVEYISNAVYSG
jgi:HK97 family phage prohead protease